MSGCCSMFQAEKTKADVEDQLKATESTYTDTLGRLESLNIANERLEETLALKSQHLNEVLCLAVCLCVGLCFIYGGWD